MTVAEWDAEQRGWLGSAAWESGRAQTLQLKLGLLSPLGSPAPMKSWNYAKAQLERNSSQKLKLP